jgi:DNA modification methylase
LDDALFVLRGLESESVDCVIIDPPYGTGANTVAGRLSSPISKYRDSGVKSSLPSIAGDAMLPDAWAEMMAAIMMHALRVCLNSANALWFCDWRGYPSLMRIAGNVGWGIKGLLVWDKWLRAMKRGAVS